MKIAICGLFDFRNEIITRLPGKAILSVYFEFSSLFQKRIFDFTPVFPYQDVSSFKETIDFFVISYKEGSTLQSAIHTLKEAGIPSSKIILYSDFRASTCVDPLSRFNSLPSKGFETLIFGMSHAKSDIRLSALSHSAFSFAAPSMDIFCHYSILKFLYRTYPETMKNVRYFLFDLPYYSFDYDLSLQRSFRFSKMIYFRSFNDYHHIDDPFYISSFVAFYSVFIDGVFSQGYYSDIFTPNSQKISIREKAVAIKKSLSGYEKIWKKSYPSTIAENSLLWTSLVDLIQKNSPAAEIIVAVLPFNPVFRRSHPILTRKKKMEFYQNINVRPGIHVIDFFADNLRSSDFMDHCHLRPFSSEEWSFRMNERLFGKGGGAK